MKSACVFLLALSGVSAFAPAQTARPATTQLAATEELASIRGANSPETGGKTFDPVGLAQWVPADFLRKAELSNGRSAMLATVGWFWPSLVGTFTSDDVTSTDPVEAFLQADPQWWAQFLLFCGTIEAYKYREELNGASYTGDVSKPAAIDWTGQWAKMDDAKKESMAVSELKNGRLAMIGIAGFFANHLIPGACPVPPGF